MQTTWQALLAAGQPIIADGGMGTMLIARGLQRAGYATDPLYGQKLGQVINTTLRLQRDMA